MPSAFRQANLLQREARASCGDEGPTFHWGVTASLYEQKCVREWEARKRTCVACGCSEACYDETGSCPSELGRCNFQRGAA